jgi:capsid protein
LRVKGGLSTREIEIAKFGGDWRRLFRQLDRENRMATELNLSFTADATKDASQSGQTVMEGEAA